MDRERASSRPPPASPQLLSREDSQVKKTPVVEGSIHPLGSLSLFRLLRCLVTFFCLHPPASDNYSFHTYLHVLCRPLEHLTTTLVLPLYPPKSFPTVDRLSYKKIRPAHIMQPRQLNIRLVALRSHGSPLIHCNFSTHSLTHPSGSPIKATIWPSSINQSINWSPLLIHPPSQQFPQHTNATC